MQVGDLIKWIDYKGDTPVEYVGLLIEDLKDYWANPSDWNDFYVLCGGEYVYWTSWQCVVYDGKE